MPSSDLLIKEVQVTPPQYKRVKVATNKGYTATHSGKETTSRYKRLSICMYFAARACAAALCSNLYNIQRFAILHIVICACYSSS